MNDEKLRDIVHALSETRGDDLLNNITLALANTINADYTFVAELNQGHTQATTLSLATADGLQNNMTYDLEGSPCANVIGGSVCVHVCGIQALFPNDQLLVEMAIEGYVGAPLYNQQSDVIGLVVALYKSPVINGNTVEPLFLLFAGMIAGEIERKSQAEQLKLSQRVLDTCEDGIMICDEDIKITYVNRAFETTTGYSETDVLGHSPSAMRSGRHSSLFYQAMWRDIDQKGGWSGEVWNRKKDGTVYPSWLTVSTVTSSEGSTSHYTGILKDITVLKEAEDRIHYQATHDLLTNLVNRHVLHTGITDLIKKAERSSREFSVVMIDIDHFKHINDSYGHASGDSVLVALGSLLSTNIRSIDVAGRWGGEEFVVICDDTGTNGAHALALKLRNIIAAYEFEVPHKVTASFGVAQYLPGETFSDLFTRVDKALYGAKSAGRDQVITAI